MAALLKGAAASAVNKGPSSSFYSGDKPNPVYQSLDAELNKYVGYMKKRVQPGYKKPSEEAASRPADTLFELWNKYEPKLPLVYYQRKLLEIGDFLVSVKEYNLALWQCYGRYLKHFGDLDVEEITECEKFKKVFFPSGFDGTAAGFTFRALMGKSICTYQVVKMTDPKLQNVESVEKCIQLLNFLRFVTQVILPRESLCWLVFNGTVHIYSICRHLMTLGHSAKVFEYVLWASMCIESSVPLMGVKYLTWRTTLYTAVCQCYFDCKNGQHAEAFARRALSKINELSQLESMSNSPENPTVGISFRQATVKMAVMVYKRTVFESRRKPKGVLRPKTRANLKDAAQQPWPRTQSEKLLAEMFEGSSAQILGVLESLTDSNRRTLLSSPAAADSEVEILDVNAELFMAAQELIAGGGGTRALAPSHRPAGEFNLPNMGGVCLGRSLIEMAAKGEDGIPLSTVVRVVKLAYCYEMWDTFDSMLDNTIAAIKEANDPKFGPDEKSLEILKAFDKVQTRAKQRKLFVNEDEDIDVPVLPAPPTHAKSGGVLNDDLIHLAETLLSVVNGPFKYEDLDMDMITDACLWLWNKCKAIFQKYQTGASDNPKYLQKMDNPGKWVYILDIVHRLLGWCGLNAVDPALTAEVVLRLALVFEASAALDDKMSKSLKGQKVEPSTQDVDLVSMITSAKDFQSRHGSQQTLGSGNIMASRTTVFSAQILNQGMREQLMQARDILELGLRNVSYARAAVALSDGKSIADVSWAKELNKEVFAPVSADDKEEDVQESDATSVSNTVKDLHMELIFMYHRVSLKLAALGPDPALKVPKPFVRTTCSRLQFGSSENLPANYVENYEELQAACRRSQVTKALLAMQKAHSINNLGKTTTEQKQYLEEAKSLIVQAQAEEKRMYLDNKVDENSNEMSGRVKRTKVPPPPILLRRTDSSMVFRPATFIPSGGEKVAWYRLFCRTSSGSNVKVRLNDYFYPGTGLQVPAFRCELRVEDLSPGDKYVCAVAAYTTDGQLIGGGIGESTKPILASHPMSLLLTWAFLCQVSYQVGYYTITREAALVLWNHFVAEPPPPQQVTYETGANQDFSLTLHRLNKKVVSLTSPVLLRMFLSSIFVHVDINVKDGALFCDTLCDKGPLIKGQIGRLRECERMLVALELAGWLNESSMALQAVVQCYGVLAPLIHFKIPAIPVIQILERCHTILQEIPNSLRQKRSSHVVESLHHMTACLTYHLAKVLRTWNQRHLATSVNEAGRKMLSEEEKAGKDAAKEKERAEKAAAAVAVAADTSGMSLAEGQSTVDGELEGAAGEADQVTEEHTETGSLTLAALKRKKARKGAPVSASEDSNTIGNEELKALEALMLRLSKQDKEYVEGKGRRKMHGDHELSGNEDPSILHAYIAYMPSKIAYREVAKFKRRARYLEFFVQVAQKALQENLPELALEWCDDSVMWLLKRNEQVIGSKIAINRQPGAVTVVGDDPKKFAAAMVEYSRDKGPIQSGKVSKTTTHSEQQSPPRMRDKQAKKATVKLHGKKIKYKAVGVTTNMSEAQKQAQEEAEIRALQILSLYLVDKIHTNYRRRRLRKICSDEAPWRSQLNIVQGLSQFGVFLHKLEFREKVLGNASNHPYKTSFLDQEWFTFETAGTLVVGWEGGPSRVHTRQGEKPQLSTRDTGRKSGIEIAARVATGKAAAGGIPETIPEVDSPRTYRTETHGKPGKGKRGGQEEDLESALITPAETREMLSKTFNYFRRALVLAHRGQHWTLLQNAARALWNCTHTALLRTYAEENTISLLDLETLRGLSWDPFYVAADCLLDMLVQLQQEKPSNPKKRQQDMPFTVGGWTGDVKSEKGGASLKFEELLDDMTSVDLRFITRIVLRVMELLHYEQKWERLVDVALRFNAVTDDRHVEQVNPLLVQAQRKLVARIKQYEGPTPPQPHYKNTKRLTSKQYVTKQLKVAWVDDGTKIDPGARIDPEGHDVYEGGLRAKQLSCVPLDINSSLHSLRQALDKSNYTARALTHSRKLLALYLAGQQNSTDGAFGPNMSHVNFVPNTAHPQPTTPQDLSREEFLSMDDIQTSTLPRSQIGVVMTSYDKSIELLVAGNQKGLASQAMRELANLLYHAGNIRGAYRWWTESLDMLLNTKDALHSWRQLQQDKENFSQVLLDRCGLWGCILGGVITSNIAQYILTSDLGLRTECCFLSGYFFKALFRSSLPHPSADRDYALYEVGEGCEVTNLVPGVDLMSERFRCDGRTLVAALRFIMDELGRGKHGLFVLPLLTLYQYFTTFVCRDLQRNVDGRILKVRVLTDMGLYSEALTVLQQLLNGDRLPHTSDNNFRQLESRSTAGKFDCSKPILDVNNLRVLEVVLDKRLSSNLGTLYGPHLTCQLTIAQAHLFVKLASTMPVLPKFDDITPPGGVMVSQLQTISTLSRGVTKGPHLSFPCSRPTNTVKPGRTDKHNSSAKEGDENGSYTLGALEEPESSIGVGRKFTQSEKPMSLQIVKGTLLAVADQMLGVLADVIMENAAVDKGIDTMSAAELEMVVLCKLEMAEVASQRHHAAMASRIVLMGLKILQSSALFDEKKGHTAAERKTSSMKSERRRQEVHLKLVQPESSQFQYQNFQSRSRLDARLWLQARLALVKAMMGEIRGMGQVKGTEYGVKVELGDVRKYCAEGVAEAEACGDVESQAEFLMQGVLLDMMEGSPVNHTKLLLQDIVKMLGEVEQLSPSGQRLRALCMVHLADLDAAAPPSNDQTLMKMQDLGERIEHRYPVGEQLEFSTPVGPLHNVYLPQLLPLVQIKCRIGHALSRHVAKEVAKGIELSQVAVLWARPLGVLNTALNLSEVITERIASLEAEILLNLGKIQRQMYSVGQFNMKVVVDTLLRAICTSYANDHDLGLIHQAYLELAVLLLTNCGLLITQNRNIKESQTALVDSTTNREPTTVDSVPGDEIESGGDSPKQGRRSKKPKNKKEKSKVTTSEATVQRDKDRKAAWAAVRCAAAVGQAIRSRLLLTGHSEVTSKSIDTKAQKDLPEFAMLDMISAYVLGERKRIYKDEIEEELAPLTEALEPPPLETYADQLDKARKETHGLSWVQILGYQSILKRLCSTMTMTAIKPVNKNSEQISEEFAPELDLGFMSHQFLDVTANFAVVRSVLFSPGWSLRLNHLHQYLCSNLRIYATECIAVYPPTELMQLRAGSGTPGTDLMIVSKSYEGNKIMTNLKPNETTGQPPASQENPHKSSDKHILNPSAGEVSLQWYRPSLEHKENVDPEDPTSPTVQILALWGMNKKNEKPNASMMWVNQHHLIDLHDRLLVLTQRGEISLVEKEKSKKDLSQGATSGRESVASKTSKRQARIKALSPKVKRDEILEALLKQCMNDAQKLVGVPVEEPLGPEENSEEAREKLSPSLSSSTEAQQIPFEVTKANVHNFEKLFDPSYGYNLKETKMVNWITKQLS